MRIKLLKTWNNNAPGAYINPQDDLALTLIDKGYAVRVEPEPEPRAIAVETAEAPAPAETAEAPQPKKRGRPRKNP